MTFTDNYEQQLIDAAKKRYNKRWRRIFRRIRKAVNPN